jgi:hypothetical protein
MARLPSGRYLIQQIADDVVLFEEGSEREIVRFPLHDGQRRADASGIMRAQKSIRESDLPDEDKSFAHFWAGYFYAFAAHPDLA